MVAGTVTDEFMGDKYTEHVHDYLNPDYEARLYRLYGSGFPRKALAEKTAEEQPPLTPQQQWEQLRAELLERIEQIDKEVPWSEVEPKWWLLMKEVERAALDPQA